VAEDAIHDILQRMPMKCKALPTLTLVPLLVVHT
jgi:hypothetical protein